MTQLVDHSARTAKNWLIYDRKSECYWGPDRGGYWKSIASAGLYTEAEAKEMQACAERSSERMEIAVPLEQHREAVTRLATALGITSPVADHSALIEQLEGWANTLDSVMDGEFVIAPLAARRVIKEMRQVAADLTQEDQMLSRASEPSDAGEQQDLRVNRNDEASRLRRLAKEATNGWACYARTKIEHAEIARLHQAIDEGVCRV